jgi:hypothetical protein
MAGAARCAEACFISKSTTKPSGAIQVATWYKI